MAKPRETEKLTIDERDDGVYVNIGQFGDTPLETRWNKTLEALHTVLSFHGWHRISKQKDSQIGGEYTR